MQCKQYKDFMKEYQYYRTFLWKYRKNGYAFKDHYFHPNMKIYESKVDLDPSKIEWKRFDKVYKAPLFDPSLISIDYIKQGSLGDCYFISGLLRIAKQPQLVSKLFDTKTADTILGRVKNSVNVKCGAVVVFFHAFGQETPVLIDTRLPFYKGTSTLVFSHPANTHVSPWFCLVEKAYAKLFGSYSNISGGNFTDSIYSLFGYQPLNKAISGLIQEEKTTKKSLFNRIIEYQKQGGVMSVAINEQKIHKSSQELKAVGLVSNHAYLLLKVVELKGMHFFNLRNPWGKYEWNGDWSDKSPLWTKELRDALKLKKSDDGAFWMIEKDFVKYFTSLDVSRPIPENWHSKTFTIEMWPGDSDGCDPESNQAQIDKKPNYGIKITQNVQSNQKVDLFFLIERRSYFPNKVTLVKHKPSKYVALFVLSNGKKLSQFVMKHSSRFYLTCNNSISYHKYRLASPKDILTFAFQRIEKSPVYEECSIRVACNFEFDLYDLDNPKNLVESSNGGIGKVFDNLTTIHYMSKPRKSKNDKLIKKYFRISNVNDSPRNKQKSKDDDDDDDDEYEKIFDDDDESSSSEEENSRECDDDNDELIEERSRTEREVNEIADKQQKLLGEINQLEDQVDQEDDEEKRTLLNKKIEQKRNKLEELEDKIKSLLDKNDKTFHKTKNKKEKKPEDEKIKPKKSDDDDEKQKPRKSDEEKQKPKKKSIPKPKVTPV